MSLTASPPADAPYAAAIHSVELDDYGPSFRPVAPGLFTCPIDADRLEAISEVDEVRALLRAAETRPDRGGGSCREKLHRIGCDGRNGIHSAAEIDRLHVNTVLGKNSYLLRNGE